MKIGCHVSIAGNIWESIDRALEVGCEAFQIFTQNQRQWKSVTYSDETVQHFKEKRQSSPFGKNTTVSHASYLINLCAEDSEKLERSRQAFVDELKRCDALGIDYLVVHPGSSGKMGEEWGVQKVAETLNFCFESYQPSVTILLETTAGQGNNIGYRFEQLRAIYDQVKATDRLGFCVDTCHIFAAGYDIHPDGKGQQTLVELDRWLGLKNVPVWHFNDSLKEKGSRKDRHAPLGEGLIGIEPFEFLINAPQLRSSLAILEIPGGMEKFAENIALLKKLRRTK